MGTSMVFDMFETVSKKLGAIQANSKTKENQSASKEEIEAIVNSKVSEMG